jgi:hypothetical protein
MTVTMKVAVLLLLAVGALNIWFWVYRAKELARGRAAFWEWRKSADSTKWSPEEGFFPLSLLEGNSVFFGTGVVRAVYEERRILLDELLKDEDGEAKRDERRHETQED